MLKIRKSIQTIIIRLSNSRVMLLNLTSSVTELAKNLILSGVNVYLYDKNKKKKNIKVKDGDINSNFFRFSNSLISSTETRQDILPSP